MAKKVARIVANDNAEGFALKVGKHTPNKPLIVKAGEYVKFGRYPQNNDSAKKPIEWLVLQVNYKEAFLVSRYGLDCQPYNQEYTGMTWENCSLRKWLNNDFLKRAFVEEEQQIIKLSDVANDNNLQYGTRGGKNTRDRVFCLSFAEAELYFNDDNARLRGAHVVTKAEGETRTTSVITGGCGLRVTINAVLLV